MITKEYKTTSRRITVETGPDCHQLGNLTFHDPTRPDEHHDWILFSFEIYADHQVWTWMRHTNE